MDRSSQYYYRPTAQQHTARKSQIIYACSSALCMYFNNASSQIKKRRAILEPIHVPFGLLCSELVPLLLVGFWLNFMAILRVLLCAWWRPPTHTHTQSGTFSFVLYAYFLHIYSAFINYVSTRQLLLLLAIAQDYNIADGRETQRVLAI